LGEDIVVPPIKYRASIGLEADVIIKPENENQFKIDYPTVLMDKMKVLQLGLRIKGLRRLRWQDLKFFVRDLEVKTTFLKETHKAFLDLERSRAKNYKQQRDLALKEVSQLKKWYRSWPFGMAVGVTITSILVTVITISN
jgi:hypothetical protein